MMTTLIKISLTKKMSLRIKTKKTKILSRMTPRTRKTKLRPMLLTRRKKTQIKIRILKRMKLTTKMILSKKA